MVGWLTNEVIVILNVLYIFVDGPIPMFHAQRGANKHTLENCVLILLLQFKVNP